jgi:predicted transcriptional regulator
MPNTELKEPQDLLAQTVEIVSSYVSNNTVAVGDLPRLMEEPEKAKPAVPVKKSITPDYLICLEDGKKLKMLKRHLKTAYDMTPDEYRARWDLPSDYPMVAPNYARRRSQLAKEIGLGTGGRGRGRGRKK